MSNIRFTKKPELKKYYTQEQEQKAREELKALRSKYSKLKTDLGKIQERNKQKLKRAQEEIKKLKKLNEEQAKEIIRLKLNNQSYSPS